MLYYVNRVEYFFAEKQNRNLKKQQIYSFFLDISNK